MIRSPCDCKSSVHAVIVLSAQSVRRLSAWIYSRKEDLASCVDLFSYVGYDLEGLVLVVGSV